MTRMLSELLGAKEPGFSLNLRSLERVSGEPNSDIRLSAEILQRTQSKLRELGLDLRSTTGEELYGTLKQRLLDDEERLKGFIGLPADSGSTEILAGARRFVRGLDVPRSCFALKNSSVKRLLKNLPPAKTLKQLGYRSLESMLKHEPLPQIYAAALVYEPSGWHERLASQYESLGPADFEVRTVEIFYPTARRWETVAQIFSDRFHHASACFTELGAITVLPVAAEVPALAITSVLLLLEDINTIRCGSTFLKLQQVKPDFGRLVAQVASDEPYTTAKLAGTRLPWKVLHEYYDSAADYDAALFEPHIQPEDLKLAHTEKVLAESVPALEFWIDTPGLALMQSGEPVSLNVLDAALNAVNDLPYDQRFVHHMRRRVWHDLLARYLNRNNLDKVVGQLSDELAEPVAEPEEALS